MVKPDDNKVKSITFLVRSLLIISILVIALSVISVYNLYSSEVVHIADQPPEFRCGTCEAQINSHEQNTYFNGKDGKSLFKANCSSCHTASQVNTTGPGLNDVLGRIPPGDWKYIYVRDHDSLVRSGDAYAIALFEEYKTSATRFPQLSNDEIDAILSYADASKMRY